MIGKKQQTEKVGKDKIEYLILVDKDDNVLGKNEKLLIHQLGLLHRAFSVFIFNTNGELLLQQRAETKYHSPLLWTNTCCSHPHFGENIEAAILRRLQEEMGIVCDTKFVFNFTYRASFENGLTEHEFDHVYFGISNQVPVPNPMEVQNWKYFCLENLETDINIHPENYTEWLIICMPTVRKHYNLYFNSNQ